MLEKLCSVNDPVHKGRGLNYFKPATFYIKAKAEASKAKAEASQKWLQTPEGHNIWLLSRLLSQGVSAISSGFTYLREATYPAEE